MLKLLIKKNQTEYLEKEIIAKINPIGRDEFAAAGQKGFKASAMFEVWEFEYDGQTEIEANNKKMVIYRTYGPRADGKIELYTGEKVGKA